MKKKEVGGGNLQRQMGGHGFIEKGNNRALQPQKKS